jgi:hypothetical protein
MATKYIVNNVSGQTINGDLSINGNVIITGTTTNIGFPTYRALLTQTEQVTGTSITYFNGALIVGEEYTITNYQSGDDFSNVANVTSGVINQTGCVFIASGTTPSIWGFNSELSSSGNLVVDVLENTLGIEDAWNMNLNGLDGMYYMVNDSLPFIYNTFPRDTTFVKTQPTSPTFPPVSLQFFSQPLSYTTKDDVIILYVYDLVNEVGTNNRLYFTPIEINLKQNPNTTPIILSGSVQPTYPFSYVSVELSCDGTYIEDFDSDSTTVNNLTELINQLNNDPKTGYLGTYSDDGNDGVLLSITTRLKEQFCSTGTLTFEVVSD